jgi:DNA processing protein
VIPAGNLPEVSTFRAVTVRGAYTLRDVVDGLRGDLNTHRRGTGEVLDHLHELRTVRACLAWLVEPGDERLTELLAAHGPFDTLDWIYGHPYDVTLRAEVRRNVPTAQLRGEATRAVDAAERAGAWVVIPEDVDWPAHLTNLASPDPLAVGSGADASTPGALCLWVRGTPPLGLALHRSVTLVGARAATDYGVHVATDLAHDLTGRGWTVLASGGYGIDTAAHRGALAADGTTVAVLPVGVDRPFPTANAGLFDRIAERGLLVSMWPPGAEPTRTRFQGNQRLLASLSCGTVVVEAAHRGGALATLAQAIALGRPAMVVPGPVTSVMSAGCHHALRAHREVRAVTTAAEVVHDIDAATPPR